VCETDNERRRSALAPNILGGKKWGPRGFDGGVLRFTRTVFSPGGGLVQCVELQTKKKKKTEPKTGEKQIAPAKYHTTKRSLKSHKVIFEKFAVSPESLNS